MVQIAPLALLVVIPDPQVVCVGAAVGIGHTSQYTGIIVKKNIKKQNRHSAKILKA